MRLRKDSEIMSTRKEKAMKVFSKLHALIACVLLVTCPLVRASAAVAMQDQRFSNDELDQLLSPIALYPDPLLAQVVPAATFFDQLQEANQVLGGQSDDNAISNQSWDISVKSVAHYPQVLQKMVQDSDWTIALGQAYVNQSTDVAKSIQRLRAEAKSAGRFSTLELTPMSTQISRRTPTGTSLSMCRTPSIRCLRRHRSSWKRSKNFRRRNVQTA